MNLDVHVWRNREGRHQARCTGTVDGRQETVVATIAPSDDSPERAAEIAVKAWCQLFAEDT